MKGCKFIKSIFRSINKLIVGTAFLSVGVCLAGSNSNNAYVGGALNVTSISDQQEFGFYSNKIDNPGRYNFNKTITGDCLSAILFAGYQWQINRIYVAGEIDANFIHQPIVKKTSDYKIRSSLENEIAAQLRLGYVNHSDALLYVLVGLARAKIERKVSFIPGGNYDDNSLALSGIRNIQTAYGPEVGLGFQKEVVDRLSLRLEYVHTFYNKGNADVNGYKITFNNPKGKNTFQINTNRVILGVTYLLG
jgi:opacity protein-like surface antigen